MPLPASHRPQASDDRGQPGGPAVLGERVQEGVGGRVVALAGAAERRRRPRRTARTRPGRRPGSARAGARPRRPWAAAPRSTRSGVSALDDAVVEDPGGVHHGGQRLLGGTRPAARPPRRRSAASQAASGHRRRPARSVRRTARRRLGGAGAAAAGQQQVARAVPRDQVPGDQAAQGAGATGDQNGAVRVERAAAARGPAAQPGQPGHPTVPAPDGELRFAGGDRRDQPARALRVRVQVGQDEAVRVLGLRRADQAPDRAAARSVTSSSGRRRRAVGDQRPAGPRRRPGRPASAAR